MFNQTTKISVPALVKRITLIGALWLFWTPGGRAEGLLIFSETHESEASRLVSEEQGRMNVTISSFEPIEKLKIDGVEQPLQEGDYYNLSVPFQLMGQRGVVRVEVKTESGWVTREYPFELQRQTEEAGPRAWGLLVLLTAQRGDNLLGEAASAQQGFTSNGLLLIPNYTFGIGDQRFELSGLLLRERIVQTELQGNEVAYEQAEIRWKSGWSGLKLEPNLGLAHVATGKPGLTGQSHLESDGYVGLDWAWPWTPSNQLEGKLKLTERRFAPAEVPSYELSGLESLVELVWRHEAQWGSYRNLVRLKQSDALGFYQDTQEAELLADGQWNLWSWGQFRCALLLGKKAYAQYDPSKEAQEQTFKSEISWGLIGPIGSGGLKWALDHVSLQNFSNVDGNSYQNNNLTFSLIYGI
ncbi:MAG: hypothetical protein RRB13_13080 [bacterium]|nr:hypothetical protein [bacterium]